MKLNRLWQPQLFAGVLLGFLLGRALPASQIAPFGIAFAVAVRAAGFRGPGALAVALAVILGSATVISGPRLVIIALAVLISQPLASLLRLGIRGATPKAAVVAAAAVAGIPAIAAFNLSDIVTMLFSSGLTGVLALVFTLAIQDATSGRNLFISPSESPVPVVILLACALCGLQYLPAWGGASLHFIVASAVIMFAAYIAGPGMGTVVATVFAVSFLAVVNPNAPSSMSFVVAGLLAGTFRELRKVGVAIGFSLGFVTYAAIWGNLQDLTELRAVVASALLGTALFWMLPARWLNHMLLLLQKNPEPIPPEAMAESPGDTLAERLKNVARVLREVGRTFEQVAAVSAPVEPPHNRVLDQVTERVCHTCSMYRQCWETDVNRTSQLFSELWTQLDESGPLPTHPAPESLEQHCIYSPQVAFTLNYLHDLHRSRDHWERQIAEGRDLAGDYARNVARMLERLADEASLQNGKTRLETTPVMRVVSGVARLPVRGVHVSGDSYVGAQLTPDRYLLALSDGMGVGKGAASESRQCVALLEEMLGAGLGTEVAVNTVNSVLLLRSTDDAFATVDLALLDLGTGQAEFVKVGAAPSFIKRGDEVTVIKMAAVPAGIMNQVHIEPEFRQLRPGDIVVLITDGIWDVSQNESDKERWLISHLQREDSTDPEEIAEGILASALDITSEASDDMTVLVARIDPISGKVHEAVRPKSTSGWVAARSAPRQRN